MDACAVVADASGNIYDNPNLFMVINRAGQWSLPHEDELMPLPPESELFLLPGRHAVGFDPVAGGIVETEELAVAAFVAPGHTLSAHPAYKEQTGAPLLPLFAYGAVGFANGQFVVSATCVDNDPRQRFAGINPLRIEREGKKLMRAHPKNRLVGHIITNCVRRYACPAARNFALGRYEAPLPTATVCNARCIGCISAQDTASPIMTTPQCRMTFIPTAKEIAEVMSIHASRERKRPIYSFGQGCEGDPLTNASLLEESIGLFRQRGGQGTINCNSNASIPEAIPALAEAGLTSLRVSLNSARPELYMAYYRPHGYSFEAVRESIKLARANGLYVSLNFLYFPGVTDTWGELEALAALCHEGVSMIQLRNLNIDPGWYPKTLGINSAGKRIPASFGIENISSLTSEKSPRLNYGYFNPYLGEKAEITAPMPS